MFTAAIIIYVIMAFLTGPLWPLELIGGKGGILGYILVIGWICLLIGGFNS